MILVVDDESESRALLMTILTAEGYRVRAADGGDLALASLSVKRPELILLDIRMPGMDGYEVCRRLKQSENTRNIPVIFLSATGDVAERVEAFRLGAVDFISKPFQRDELLARARTHLELGRLRAHLQEQVEERTAELKESEQRFRTMADAAPVMIWVSDVDRQCTFFNKGWLDFTGRTSDEEVGDGWATGVHSDDLERCIATYFSSFDKREKFQMEYRLRRYDGEYRWMLDRGVPRFTSSGDFAGYIGSCIDITELKENNERLLATQKMESLGLMAAGIAHDFGNFLASIFVETDSALLEMEPDSPGRASVERIASVANFATDIVGLLLASSGAGVDPTAVERVDLSHVVEEMVRLLRTSTLKHARVRTDLARDLPPLLVNVGQIRQVVMNLIINASEALGRQPGWITVTTDKVAGDSRYVRLRVSDTGCGMTAETRARIFDQFFTTKSYGRGLGLAAVYGILRSHAGVINVASTPGAGTTFEVLLPCVTAADETRPAHLVSSATP